MRIVKKVVKSLVLKMCRNNLEKKKQKQKQGDLEVFILPEK